MISSFDLATGFQDNTNVSNYTMGWIGGTLCMFLKCLACTNLDGHWGKPNKVMRTILHQQMVRMTHGCIFGFPLLQNPDDSWASLWCLQPSSKVPGGSRLVTTVAVWATHRAMALVKGIRSLLVAEQSEPESCEKMAVQQCVPSQPSLRLRYLSPLPISPEQPDPPPLQKLVSACCWMYMLSA